MSEYINQGFKVKKSLYKTLLRQLHRQEKTFKGWLEEQMLAALEDPLDWLAEKSTEERNERSSDD